MDERHYVVVEDSVVELSQSDLESLPDVPTCGEVWKFTTRENLT